MWKPDLSTNLTYLCYEIIIVVTLVPFGNFCSFLKHQHLGSYYYFAILQMYLYDVTIEYPRSGGIVFRYYLSQKISI